MVPVLVTVTSNRVRPRTVVTSVLTSHEPYVTPAPESWSATNVATHAMGAFQLTVISLVDHEPMSSMYQNCWTQPVSLAAATGSPVVSAVPFGPPARVPRGGLGSRGSTWWAYIRLCWFWLA